MLIKENAKVVVVACNSASSVALTKLKENFSIPIMGVIEPGAGAAVATTKNRHIGVIGTRATIRSGAYEKALHALDDDLRVSGCACPLFVPLIEEGLLDDEITDQMIARYLVPLAADGVDTLVLGCTHYPLLSTAIARSLGDKIQLVDSTKSCARAVEDLLDRQSLRASAAEKGNLLVALTDAADNFLRVAREALKLELAEVKVCEVFDSPSTGCRHERN
jgi:glutamate racemase